ncbi:hypothetical protein H1C71_040032 [Ictidomys tridecemlineatus]|nr:hypothetical protein H1C71_040032 [Ictidomys tridecemlineatus]
MPSLPPSCGVGAETGAGGERDSAAKQSLGGALLSPLASSSSLWSLRLLGVGQPGSPVLVPVSNSFTQVPIPGWHRLLSAQPEPGPRDLVIRPEPGCVPWRPF